MPLRNRLAMLASNLPSWNITDPTGQLVNNGQAPPNIDPSILGDRVSGLDFFHSRMKPDALPDDEEEQTTPSNILPFGGQRSKLSTLANNTPMMDKYNSSTNEFPDAGKFAPNGLSRLAAVMGGVSAGYRDPLKGVQTAQTILNSPYDRAVGLWGAKNSALKDAAKVEETGITNKRLAENEDQRNLIAAGKEISEQNLREAQAAYYGARTVSLAHPDWKLAKANGRVIMVNPKDPSKKVDIGDANIISSDALGQQINKFRTENGIKVSGEVALEGVKQANRKENLKTTEKGKDERAKLRTNAPGKISATQYRTAHSTAIQEVLGDPKNAGLYKNIINPPSKDQPYYTIKDVNDAGPNDLNKHEELIKQIKERTNSILGRTGDITIPSSGEADNDIDIEEEGDQ